MLARPAPPSRLWRFPARRRRGPGSRGPGVAAKRENRRVNVARIGWLVTVLACLVAVLILVLQGYYGYAGVTFAVAVAAAINLA